MKAPEPKRIAVGVSGSGRSLENFLKKPSDAYRIAGVIASRADCRAVDIAQKAGLALFIGDFSAAERARTEGQLYAWLEREKIDLVALAGFLKIFPVRPAWARRVVNIHPALLPKFGGKGMYGHHVHEAVIAAGEKKSGATVHYVDGRYDEGDVIQQVEVDVRPGDDAQTLAARVFEAECRVYPEVLARLARE